MNSERTRIADALRDACAIVDEILPWELPPGHRSTADRTELRKSALLLVFGALLRVQEIPLTLDPKEPGHDELLRPSQISFLFNINPGTISQWRDLGIITPDFQRGHTIYYRRSEIAKVVDMSPEERDALRIPVVAVSGEDIDRMRKSDRLSWGKITQKTGIGKAALMTIHRKWLYEQSEPQEHLGGVLPGTRAKRGITGSAPPHGGRRVATFGKETAEG